MYYDPNPLNLHGYEHTEFMQSPHRYKRRHIQFTKVIHQLESIIFSKRQLKKIYKDQERLRQFRMKKTSYTAPQSGHTTDS